MLLDAVEDDEDDEAAGCTFVRVGEGVLVLFSEEPIFFAIDFIAPTIPVDLGFFCGGGTWVVVVSVEEEEDRWVTVVAGGGGGADVEAVGFFRFSSTDAWAERTYRSIASTLSSWCCCCSFVVRCAAFL